MANGVRNSIWAAFFLAGMAFMATLIFMLRPDLLSNQPVRIVNSAPRIIAGNAAPVAEKPVEPLPLPPLIPIEPVSSHAESKPAIHLDQQAQAEQPASPTAAVVRAAPAPQSPVARPPVNPAGFVRIVGRVQPGRSAFGHVSLTGSLPPPKSEEVFCGDHAPRKVTSRAYVRGEDDSLADVLVVVTEGLNKSYWKTPAQAASIVQKNCQFQPYVTAIQLGQSLSFENLDGQLHDISIYDERGNVVRDITQLPKSRPALVQMKEAGQFIRIGCKLHPWMVAYVNVIEHPFFAMTGSDGRFEIQNLPPGDYTITATHRKAGTLSQKITVTGRESPQLEFAFVPATEVAEKK